MVWQQGLWGISVVTSGGGAKFDARNPIKGSSTPPADAAPGVPNFSRGGTPRPPSIFSQKHEQMAAYPIRCAGCLRGCQCCFAVNSAGWLRIARARAPTEVCRALRRMRARRGPPGMMDAEHFPYVGAPNKTGGEPSANKASRRQLSTGDAANKMGGALPMAPRSPLDHGLK